jgi:hypothetical protein
MWGTGSSYKSACCTLQSSLKTCDCSSWFRIHRIVPSVASPRQHPLCDSPTLEHPIQRHFFRGETGRHRLDMSCLQRKIQRQHSFCQHWSRADWRSCCDIGESFEKIYPLDLLELRIGIKIFWRNTVMMQVNRYVLSGKGIVDSFSCTAKHSWTSCVACKVQWQGKILAVIVVADINALIVCGKNWK